MNKYEYHMVDTLKHKAAIMNCLAALIENYEKEDYSFINLAKGAIASRTIVDEVRGTVIGDIINNTKNIFDKEIKNYEFSSEEEILVQYLRYVCVNFQNHDDSKISNEDEFNGYADVVYKLNGLEHGTPEHKTAIKELDEAFTKYHIPQNPHHPEYHHMDLRNMNLNDFIEMICDWCAATICRGFVFKFSSIYAKKEKLDLDDFTISVIKANVKIILKPDQYDENN